MSYVIRRTNGEVLRVVNDREVVSNYSTKLCGRQVNSYGEILNNNFIRLLENNANLRETTPQNPILGQSWFQYNADGKGRLSICIDETSKEFRPLQYINFISGVNGGKQLVDKLEPGELFYDVDTGNLKVVLDSSTTRVIGPIVDPNSYQMLVKKAVSGVPRIQYNYVTTISNEGAGYQVGDKLTCGIFTVTVKTVDEETGAIKTADVMPKSGNQAENFTEDLVSATSSGSGAQLTVSSEETGSEIVTTTGVTFNKLEINPNDAALGVYLFDATIIAKAIAPDVESFNGVPSAIWKVRGSLTYDTYKSFVAPISFELTEFGNNSAFDDNYKFEVQSDVIDSPQTGASQITFNLIGYKTDGTVQATPVSQQIEWTVVTTITAC